MKLLYKCLKTDDLNKIAKKFNVSIETLIKDNNIKNNILPENIYINSNDNEIVVVTDFKRKLLMQINEDFFKVKKKLYALGFSTINTTAQIGDKILFYPINNDIYIVNVLDNLKSIADKFNMSVEELKIKNNLHSDKLFIGQILKL